MHLIQVNQCKCAYESGCRACPVSTAIVTASVQNHGSIIDLCLAFLQSRRQPMHKSAKSVPVPVCKSISICKRKSSKFSSVLVPYFIMSSIMREAMEDQLRVRSKRKSRVCACKYNRMRNAATLWRGQIANPIRFSTETTIRALEQKEHAVHVYTMLTP